MKFEKFKQNNLPQFEEYLLSHIKETESGTELEAAMNYSLNANGKRLRPLLILAVLKSFNISPKFGYPAGSALEMIHTYSLIHDDLPAMDNDDLRRGKPTNHIQFNEATAILAGDALLTLAFEVVIKESLQAPIKVELTKLLAKTAGYQGMVGGQQADIDGEEKDLSLEEIERIHFRKTGALIQMAIVSGGIIAEKPQKILDKLSDLATEIGIAYQIRDDILDVTGTKEELGKEVATDAALGKSTYPSLLGLKGAMTALNTHLQKATEIIQSISKADSNFDSQLLISFLNQLSFEEQ